MTIEDPVVMKYFLKRMLTANLYRGEIVNLENIRQLAKSRGISPGNLTKTGLVRTIQHSEGNFGCFATAVDGVCDQLKCIWRMDCFQAARRTRRI